MESDYREAEMRFQWLKEDWGDSKRSGTSDFGRGGVVMVVQSKDRRRASKDMLDWEGWDECLEAGKQYKEGQGQVKGKNRQARSYF
jgi:hypothetical protein